MSSSRGEGCGREARGVRGARGVRTHPTSIAQLVQVVYLLFFGIRICRKITHAKRLLTASDICDSGPSSNGYWPDTIPGLTRFSVAQLCCSTNISVCPQKVLTVHIWGSIEGRGL